MDVGWEEVERLASAANAADAVAAVGFPTEEQISRWERLFNYTRREALALIQAQRSDLTRTRIPDSHWELVREEREAQGHDRETYEHSQQLGNVLLSQSAVIPNDDGKNTFLIRLGGLLESAEKVMQIAGLGCPPRVVHGKGERGDANFCIVREDAKKAIDAWLTQAQVSCHRKDD